MKRAVKLLLHGSFIMVPEFFHRCELIVAIALSWKACCKKINWRIEVRELKFRGFDANKYSTAPYFCAPPHSILIPDFQLMA